MLRSLGPALFVLAVAAAVIAFHRWCVPSQPAPVVQTPTKGEPNWTVVYQRLKGDRTAEVVIRLHRVRNAGDHTVDAYLEDGLRRQYVGSFAPRGCAEPQPTTTGVLVLRGDDQDFLTMDQPTADTRLVLAGAGNPTVEELEVYFPADRKK
jgi:hypothetical protein